MRVIRTLTRRFLTDGTDEGSAFRPGFGSSDEDPRLPWNFTLHTKPVFSNPTGTIAFDGKLEMAPTKIGPWEDVTGGGVTTITVGTEASSAAQLDNTVVLKPWLRIVFASLITGVPDYDAGVDFTFTLLTA